MNDTLLKFTPRNHITDRWLKDNPDAKFECWYCAALNQQTDPRQKFCNLACRKNYRNRARRKNPHYIKYCDWCGDEFTATRSDVMYDDVNCQRAAYRKRKGIPVLTETEIPCSLCKTNFIRTHQAQKYCSFKCFIWKRLGDKREYNHFKRNGLVKERRYLKEYWSVLVAEHEDSMKKLDETTFDKDDWNRRAKEVELRIAARFAK